MATKGDYCSSLKGKQDITVGDNGQYSNLNLNPNIQQKTDIVLSKDVTNDNRKVSNKGLQPKLKISDFNEVNDLQTKKDSNSWNKNNKDLTFFNSHRNNSSDKKGTLKGNVSKTAANCKNSTLSLHIFAYENSNEATASDFLDGKNDRRKNESLIIKGIHEKQINFDSNVFIQNPFEFPRQQEEDDKNAKPPEVMQFKASQRLLDPNDMSVMENHSSNGESTEKTEEDDEEEEEENYSEISSYYASTQAEEEDSDYSVEEIRSINPNMQAETLDQNVSNSTPELAEPVTADTADGMETKESVENITENSSNVVGNDAAAAPNLIADENALQFDLNAEFLQQQQILYQQLTGAFQNDPNTIRQRQEALSKFSINKSSSEESEAVEGDKKESEEQKPKASVHKPSETPPQNVKPSEKPEPLPRTSQPPSSKKYGRFAALMEAFRSNDKNRQSEAVYELAELLLMGNEETLPDLPIREIVALLHALLKKENNLALTLTAVRCITNMQEALPRAMPVLAETVPTLLQKLKHIECIDIAEQTLVALEVLSRRNAKSIIHAGGFSDAVMHVDFFSMPSQRLVYQIAANCASHITQQDFGLLKSCMLDLVQKLTFDDKRCCESICTFFYRLIENFRNSPDRLRDIAGKNYEFLSKVQQLFMIQPSTINSDTFVNLLKSVRFMCIKCSDVVSALINMEFGRTLRFLLIGTERADASVDITLRPPQHMREIISLISELLPPLPKIDIFEISSAVLQYMSNSIPAALALGGGNGISLHGGIGDETEMDSAVSVTWQYEEEMGNMIDFSAEMTALLEAKRAAGVTETVVFISNTPCEANLIEMKYSNHQTGFLGRIDRRITATAIEQQEEEAERDIEREKHNKRLVDLIRILFPILVEIGSATSCSNLRFEATRAMIRMMYAVESETQLKAILHNLPLASYIASTLSSNKGHSVTVSALQLVHVILDKLPRLYVPLFESEGVFFMIKKLIKDEIKIQTEIPSSSSSSAPSTAAAATSTPPPSTTTQQIQTKVINLRRGPIEVPTPNTPSVVQPPPPTTSSTVSAAATPPNVGTASIEGNFSDNSSVSSLSSINSNGSNAASQGSIPGSVTSSSTAPSSVHTFNRIAQSMLIQDESFLTARHLAVLSSSNYHSLVYPQLMQQGHLLQMNHQGGGGNSNSSILQNINQELSLAMQQANAAAAAGSNGISIATAYKQALADRITNWVSKEAKHIISIYHENENLYESDQTIVKELNRIALLFEKNNSDTGYEGLEALKALMKVNDISAFQLNHSNVIRNLAKYLADNSEERKPNREIRLKRFIETFMNMTENNLRPMNLNGDLYAPFERLVTKIVHAVGQLEQFHIKITNLSGILTESSGGSSSANNISTVLRGSNALRFFQTHQIRCNLRRHPSCKQLREWRHGRGSIKVDPFTSVSAIERYLVDRGIGNNSSATAAASDSSSDNEDGSEDDPDVASSNDSNSPSTAPFTGKIEILIGDTPVPSDLSILQAIRQFSLPHDDDQEVIPPSIWITAHTLYFRIASSSNETGDNDGSGEASSVAGSSSSTAAGTKKRKSGSKKPRSKSCKPLVFSTGKAPNRKNPIDAFLQLNLETQFVDPCYDSCVLLRILYGLNKYWWTLFEEKWPITHEAILPSSIFLSSKMNSKVQRQLSDFLSVATQQVPKWTTNIVHAVPFIFSFPVRRNLLYCTSFGRDRALMHLVTEGNDDHEGELTNRLIPRLERRKVTVKRNNLLADAISTFHQMGSSKAQLEVNFEGEVGTGFGPTLEFYSTISREIQKHSLGLWSGVSQPFSFGEDGDSEDFTIGPNGLYPISINRAIKTKSDGRTKRFEFIGRLLAQALLDSRMLDIPFSPIFFKWLLNEEDTIGAFDMEMVDKTFYNSIRSIILTEDAKDLESLELYFTMPGDETFELIKSGKSTQVNKENVQQYVDLVLHWLLVEGVRDDMLSLRKGFEQVVDPNVLKIFCCEEMEELFCGCCEGSPENDRIWSKSALQQALRPDHGYTHESPQIQWLVDMIHSFSLQDRRNFLQFCTGSPRLPVGGFRSLNPPLTVVRKTVAYGNVEGELPSAMTCYNFLKIPPYASYETFIERFRLALQYIYSFHLT